jgi:hypothetical protein
MPNADLIGVRREINASRRLPMPPDAAGEILAAVGLPGTVLRQGH